MSSLPSNDFSFLLEPKRPLKKFGKKFKIELSTALSFSPATVMQAASGLGWNQQFEKMDYKAYRALFAWKNSHERGSKMQDGTLRDLEQAFNPFEGNGTPLTPEGLVKLPNSISSPWRLLFRGLRQQFGPVHRTLLVRFALDDRTAHQIDSSRNEEERTRRLHQALLSSLQYWQSTGIAVPWQAIVPLDKLLQHLAWLDVQLSSKSGTLWTRNSIVRLAEPSQRPMRHWFDGLLNQTKQDNLADFSCYLSRHKVLSRNRVISHDMLKDWASTQELMPHHAVTAVLEGCKGDIASDQQLYCLWLARLLTFSGAVIGAFTAEPIDEKTAQKLVHERLLQLCGEIRAV